eukprot:5773025-Pleurochrysis_carterae.AAC.1
MLLLQQREDFRQKKAEWVQERLALKGEILDTKIALDNATAQAASIEQQLKDVVALAKWPLSFQTFTTHSHLRAAFCCLTSFHNAHQFHLFFKVLQCWCPPGRLQHGKGVNSRVTERYVDEEQRKGGRPPTFEPIDQFLFTMIKLRSIPNHAACCALFGISDGVGSSYFTTWVRLMQDFLTAACPLDHALEQKLCFSMPDKLKQQFKTVPFLQPLTVSTSRWNHLATSQLAKPPSLSNGATLPARV